MVFKYRHRPLIGLGSIALLFVGYTYLPGDRRSMDGWRNPLKKLKRILPPRILCMSRHTFVLIQEKKGLNARQYKLGNLLDSLKEILVNEFNDYPAPSSNFA